MSKRATEVFSKPKREKPKPETPPQAPMTGHWSKVTYDVMKDKIDVTTEELDELRQAQIEGIKAGHIPVQIHADQIIDVLGSDRLDGQTHHDDESLTSPSSFQALVENIRSRGLRTPLRVRPADPEWRPGPENPFDVSGQKFHLQSGRRRLAACRELGIPPVALISFPEGSKSEIEDLKERYFENVSRQDLSAAERLISIGTLDGVLGLSSREAAKELQVDRTYVLKGRDLVQNLTAISAMLDLKSASFREIERALSEVKRGASEGEGQNADIDATKAVDGGEEVSHLPPLPFKRKEVQGSSVTLRRNKKGNEVLTISAKHLNEDTLSAIINVLKNGQ